MCFVACHVSLGPYATSLKHPGHCSLWRHRCVISRNALCNFDDMTVAIAVPPLGEQYFHFLDWSVALRAHVIKVHEFYYMWQQYPLGICMENNIKRSGK